jgi:hypothetical protein
MYAEKAPPTDGLGKVTIDVAYVSGRSDSFSADISGKTERSGHSLLEAAGQGDLSLRLRACATHLAD